MIIIDNQLLKRERENNPIKVGVIGLGVMGTGIVNQLTRYTKGIVVSVIYNRTAKNALKVLHTIGITNFRNVESQEGVNKNIKNGTISVVEDINLMLDAEDLDVVIEMTGSIDFGLSTILEAFRKGKNVLSFNSELESLLGFYLNREAQKYQVKYGVADGDQPAATLNLYRFVKQMGLTPLVCGNVKGMQDRYRTPFTQKGFAEQWGMDPEKVTSFADGTKISVEQACIANATGMTIAKRGMLGYEAEGYVDELMHLFDPEMLKEKGGIVDYIIGPKPGPGIFIYASAPDDPILTKYLSYIKLGNGPLYCFYTPYHLLFMEIAASISRFVDFNDTILTVEQGMQVEVIAMAKTHLNKGDILDGIGGYKTYGVCETSSEVARDQLLPIGLSKGGVVLNDIDKDTAIGFEDVQLKGNNPKIDLYFKQKLMEHSSIKKC